MLDRTAIYAGVDGRMEQFTLRVGDYVNPMLRPTGILIPARAGAHTFQARFGQISAPVLKTGMTAEMACASRPFEVIPIVVTQVQSAISSGQLRQTDILVDPNQIVVRGSVTVYLEPLFEGGTDNIPPGSTCMANAHTSNHERLDDPELGTGTWLALDAIDAVGLVHAMLLRLQVVILPVRTLVLSGGHRNGSHPVPALCASPRLPVLSGGKGTNSWPISSGRYDYRKLAMCRCNQVKHSLAGAMRHADSSVATAHPMFGDINPRRPRLTYLSGFEGTQMFGHGVDVLDTSEHTLRYKADLSLLAADGISEFRCCIPWHKVESVRGIYDWSWMDSYLGYARRLGLKPIADPLHHTSFPEWLELGFANPLFPVAYESFVRAFAKRYPWISSYTIINEPVATAILSGLTGDWYPHWADRNGVARIILGKVRALHRVTAALETLVQGLRVVHVDTCEYHHALDEASQEHTNFCNDLRFVVLDLILGRMTIYHPLYQLFRENGMCDDEIARYREKPARIDVLGLDFYAHSELGWTRDGRSDEFTPRGFKAVALEYAERYGLTVMLSETNLRGRIEDRMTWLKYMVQECEDLALELAKRNQCFDGFCWYPYIDSTDWCSLCRLPNRNIDPQGVYYLSKNFDRKASELSEIYARLVSGEIGAAEIPAYRLEQEVLMNRGVAKFLRHMKDFDWKDGESSVPVVVSDHRV